MKRIVIIHTIKPKESNYDIKYDRFWQGQWTEHSGEVQIELRGVNGKHLDLKVRTPRILFPLESLLQKHLRSKLARGRVDCTLSLSATTGRTSQLQVNLPLAEAYLNAAGQLKDKFNVEGVSSAEFLLRIPEVVQMVDPEIDFDSLWEEVHPTVEEALEQFCQTRNKEGQELDKDFRKRINRLTELVAQVDELRNEASQFYHDRISKRAGELNENMSLDESRLAQEVALLAVRSDITEEVVRLRSHLEQFGSIISGNKPAGRQLDFLLQEMFREINTIGSKVDLLAITQIVLKMKTEVDKLREQAMNVE